MVHQAHAPFPEIAIFGFSRGAYEARILAGLIRVCGVLKDVTDPIIKLAWEVYNKTAKLASDNADRIAAAIIKAESTDGVAPSPLVASLSSVDSEDGGVKDGVPTAAAFRESHSHGHREGSCDLIPLIHFLGLFDTVPGLVPLVEPRSTKIDSVIVRVPRNVRSVAHALSLDETRSFFQPLAITPKDDAKWDEPVLPGGIHRTQYQEYFAGNHGDVGGGWADKGTHISVGRKTPYDRVSSDGNPYVDAEHALADVALQWMLKKAAEVIPLWLKDASIREQDDINRLINETPLPFDPADPDTHDMVRRTY